MTEVEREDLSIGALSKATGISIHSLRMWERRYGAPVPVRRASGHRRYPFEEVARLRAVARALAAGFRAREVVGASVESIDALLEGPRRGRAGEGDPIETNAAVGLIIGQWVESARRYDDRFLRQELEEHWRSLGPMQFLVQRAGPFIKAIGDGWQCGDVSISNEHFATELLGDFFSARWRERNETVTTAPFIFATLPKDAHQLGLQMCALTTAMTPHRIIYLGAQVPLDELCNVARLCEADSVCLSISASIPSRYASRQIEILRRKVGKNVCIVTGGAGAPPPQEGTMRFHDLPRFLDWLRMREPAAKG